MASPPYAGAWPRVRKLVLLRDNFTCQIRSPGCTVRATAVDHIVPVTQGGAWWDQANLRASCVKCNNARIGSTMGEAWRRSGTLITLVVGPPGSDLGAYATAHREPGDLVIDYDALSSVLGGEHGAVMAARNAVLNKLRRGEIDAKRCFLLSTNPRAEEVFPFHKVVDLGPPKGGPTPFPGGTQTGTPSDALAKWEAARHPAAVEVTPSRAW